MAFEPVYEDCEEEGLSVRCFGVIGIFSSFYELGEYFKIERARNGLQSVGTISNVVDAS